jgi:hypothetical protein
MKIIAYFTWLTFSLKTRQRPSFDIAKKLSFTTTGPNPHPFVRGTNQRIRIRTKMSRIRNTGNTFVVDWDPGELKYIKWRKKKKN